MDKCARSTSTRRRVGAHRLTASLLLAVLSAILLLVPQNCDARPSNSLSRPKRVSDSRLAELETIIALSKMKGRLVAVPIGYGKVDPARSGRRRRSSTEVNLHDLRRLLRGVIENEPRLDADQRSEYARLLLSRWEEIQNEDAYDDRGEIDEAFRF